MSSGSLDRSVDFRALFDRLDGVALWTASGPGVFEYVSAGTEDIWGVPIETVEDDLGVLIDGIHPDDRDRVLAAVGRAVEERSDQSFEHRVVRPDDAVRWVHVRVVPVRGEDDRVTLVGVSTDITEQKRRERELEVLNRIVRHDIRNDMAVILGWAEMLEGSVDGDGEEYLRKVLTSGAHVVELTEVARDYVETVTGDGGAGVEPTPLRSTLETELSLRDEAFPGAAFVHDPIPDVEVAANAMLRSVFRNLLNNAVQHNHAADPAVEVTCEVGGDDVVVRVADDGPGVPDDRKEEVFGEGERGLDSSGTGIGLSLVRTLVDQYGGEVWVEDNDPEGAAFAVRLPRAG